MHLSAWLAHPGQPPALHFLVPKKFVIIRITSLIFLAAYSKPPEDQLGDFADE